MENNLPVLYAVERNEMGDLSAWCPYCNRWHHHGSGEGHRIAHCEDISSPFMNGGYIIKKIKNPKR